MRTDLTARFVLLANRVVVIATTTETETEANKERGRWLALHLPRRRLLQRPTMAETQKETTAAVGAGAAVCLTK